MKKFPKIDPRQLPQINNMHQRASGIIAPASAMTDNELLMNALHGIVQKCCADIGIRSVAELGALVRAAPPRGFCYPVYVNGSWAVQIVGEPVE